MSNTLITAAQQITRVSGLDNYLSGTDPSDPMLGSMFAFSYKKMTPFAKNTAYIPFQEKVDFGKTISAEIPHLGDLMNSIYLYFRLPPLNITPGSNYTGWTQAIGYAMIDSVEVRIGETKIDSTTGLFMEVLDYMGDPRDRSSWRSVGRYDTVNVLPQNAVSYQDIYVPLRFWFNKKISSSLPLVTMGGLPVKIVVKLRPFNSLITQDGPIPPETAESILDAGLIIDYYILSDAERESYKVEPQKYLIEQSQWNIFEVNAGTTTGRYSLDFNKCIKELVFFFVETESEANNDYFNFGRREIMPEGEMAYSISLLFDGKERFANLPESYYRYITLQKTRSSVGDRNIYVIPFATAPELIQPSGTANFSRYDTVELVVDFIDSVPQCKLYVLGINYNVLTLEPGGAAQVEFLT